MQLAFLKRSEFMKLSKLAKTFIAWLLPERVLAMVLAVRSRRMSHKLLKRWGMPEVNDKLLKRFGNHCIGGLFPGLILPSCIQAEQMGPFLLGTYEQEIAPWFDQLRSCNYSQILDVGAKFGFYAVGLAKWYPSATVLAFDTDPWARRVTTQFASENSVTNVNCQGFCSTGWLAKSLQPHSLLICDCEGYEFVLLDPTRVPNLSTATMIVESHDQPPWGKHADLIERFSTTHFISEMAFDPNSRIKPSKLDLSFHTDHEKYLAIGEPRNHWQKWIHFRPKLRDH